MKKFSAAIFDLDGTLFDTRQAILATMMETFPKLNLCTPSSDRIYSVVSQGVNLEATFQILLDKKLSPKALKEFINCYRTIYNSGTGIHASIPFADAKVTLAHIHAKQIPIVVASNKGEESVEKILDYHGMRNLIHSIIAARDSFPTKPDPSSFLNRIVPVLGARVCSNALIIGDTETDIQYARYINKAVCWASYGYGSTEKCRALQPDFVVESLPQIAKLF